MAVAPQTSSILSLLFKTDEERQQAAERVRQLPRRPEWAALSGAQRRILEISVESTCRQLETGSER